MQTQILVVVVVAVGQLEPHMQLWVVLALL
jgi:hypothetical protein